MKMSNSSENCVRRYARIKAVQTLFQIAKQPEKSVEDALYFSVAGVSTEEIDTDEYPLVKLIAKDLQMFDENHQVIKDAEAFMRALVKGTLKLKKKLTCSLKIICIIGK